MEGAFWVRRMAARLTRFSADSELSRFNAAAGTWADVSPELEALLRESLGAFDRSAGLVNVAVLRSMEAVGYTRPLSEGLPVATETRAGPLPALPEVLSVRPGAAWLECGALLAASTTSTAPSASAARPASIIASHPQSRYPPEFPLE